MYCITVYHRQLSAAECQLNHDLKKHLTIELLMFSNPQINHVTLSGGCLLFEMNGGITTIRKQEKMRRIITITITILL